MGNDEIEKFKNLDNPDSLLQNVLIGNGFSMRISANYGYKTILNECGGILSQDRELFNQLQTSNFETCLSMLNNASIVNRLYGIQGDHTESYDRIRNSLIQTIRKIHIQYYEISSSSRDQIKSLFDKATNIFTTNYDLISYWALLDINSSKKSPVYGDIFIADYEHTIGKSDLIFSEKKSAHKSSKKLYFLHGGLHIYQENGVVKKLKRYKHGILDQIERNFENGLAPLFVSEGDWILKMQAIESNPYLRYCYSQFENIKGNLTIYGQSLDSGTDQHIIDAIKRSRITNISYGIYKNDKTVPQIELEKARIKECFDGITVQFFDSDSLYQYTFDLAFGSL